LGEANTDTNAIDSFGIDLFDYSTKKYPKSNPQQEIVVEEGETSQSIELDPTLPEGYELTGQPKVETEVNIPELPKQKVDYSKYTVSSNKEYDEIEKNLFEKDKKAYSNLINTRSKFGENSTEFKLAKLDYEKAESERNLFKEQNKDLILEHGTPHDFTKFELEKIGTGEGNQAFGYGLYFTEDSKIAKSYAEKLSKDKEGIVYTVKVKDGRINDWLEWRDALEDGQMERIADTIKGRKDEYFKYLENVENEKSHTGAAEALFQDELLDDRPIQAGALYSDLKDAFGQDIATEIMVRSGIDGVKYRTRGGKGDSFNYVIFNPESIIIEKKTQLSGGNQQKVDSQKEDIETEKQQF